MWGSFSQAVNVSGVAEKVNVAFPLKTASGDYTAMGAVTRFRASLALRTKVSPEEESVESNKMQPKESQERAIHEGWTLTPHFTPAGSGEV